MFKWIADLFNPAPIRVEPIKYPDPPPDCAHDRAVIEGHCPLGWGYCPDCQHHIPMGDVFHIMHRRLDALESKANA